MQHAGTPTKDSAAKDLPLILLASDLRTRAESHPCFSSGCSMRMVLGGRTFVSAHGWHELWSARRHQLGKQLARCTIEHHTATWTQLDICS